MPTQRRPRPPLADRLRTVWRRPCQGRLTGRTAPLPGSNGQAGGYI